ncbi:MAG: HEAT repeat domain-containing protein [Woeseia sp.]
MNRFQQLVGASIIIVLSSVAFGRDDGLSETEQLKIVAIESLITAPADRALPLVTRVLRGDDSDEVKEHALFILSQIDNQEAQDLLIEVARSDNGELREEAVRMIGISGKPGALAMLKDLYRDGDNDMREAVLEAYLITDDADSVLAIAEAAVDPEEFELAVETLGAMQATEQLRSLRNKKGMSEALIEAYAIAGDVESLRELAMDGSDPERQSEALKGLAIAGDDDANKTFMEVYRSTDNDDLKEAALEAMQISGYDEGVLLLFRESTDAAEKRELLQMLVHMDNDAVWDIIDATLEDD